MKRQVGNLTAVIKLTLKPTALQVKQNGQRPYEVALMASENVSEKRIFTRR